jgi:renalase
MTSDTTTQWDVIVVGAGLAGLICAQKLQRAGYRVAVLEKSRGLGGRLATRRVDGVAMDHGARFLQPQTPALQALVQHLHDRGCLQPWHPQAWQLSRTGTLSPTSSQIPYWVAPAGISAVGKALAEGLTIYRQHRAIALSPQPDHCWQITAQTTDTGTDAGPDAGAASTFQGRSLVLAIPAPQGLDLLKTLDPGSETTVAPALSTVRYAHCITVMAVYEAGRVGASSTLSPQKPWMVWGTQDTDFAWVGLDSSKRNAPTPRVVLQSSAAFAAAWLDLPSLQPAGEALLHRAQTDLAAWLGHPQRWQVHRWRYATVQQSVQAPCLQTQTPLPLVACGDWCGDQLADSAIASGQAAANAIAQLLHGQSLPSFAPWL